MMSSNSAPVAQELPAWVLVVVALVVVVVGRVVVVARVVLVVAREVLVALVVVAPLVELVLPLVVVPRALLVVRPVAVLVEAPEEVLGGGGASSPLVEAVVRVEEGSEGDEASSVEVVPSLVGPAPVSSGKASAPMPASL